MDWAVIPPKTWQTSPPGPKTWSRTVSPFSFLDFFWKIYEHHYDIFLQVSKFLNFELTRAQQQNPSQPDKQPHNLDSYLEQAEGIDEFLP